MDILNTPDPEDVELDLLTRVQNYIASDVNSRLEPGELPVEPASVQILSFTKTLHHWKVYAAPHERFDSYYEISHDGDLNIAIVNQYRLVKTVEAVI